MEKTAEELRAELEIATQELEKRKAKGPGTNRGVETMFRSAYRVQMELTALADNKANMMISINGIIIQDIGTRTGRGDRNSAIRRIRDRAHNCLGRFKKKIGRASCRERV